MADVTLVTPYPRTGVRHGGHSGVASYSANLASALADEGAEVRVLAPAVAGEPTRATDHGVTVHRALRWGPRALPDAARVIAREPGRVVHLQHELFLYGGPSALAGLPVAVERMRRHAPLAVTLHQVVDPAEIDRGYTRLHRVRVPAVAARAGLAGVQGYLGRRSHPIVHEEAFARLVPGARVVPHGVEVVTPPDRTAARRRLGLARHGPRPTEAEPLTVLCFGFVAPYKGLETALAAAELAGRSVELVVAGGEHPRLDDAEGYVAHLAGRHPGVARFTGFVPDDEVGLWHAAADVALLCYPRPHASSGALALALAHDTPLLLGSPVARCVGAPSELEVPLEPTRIAERLRELATERGARERLRAATRSFATGRTWPQVARSHLRLYEELSRAPSSADRPHGSRRPV